MHITTIRRANVADTGVLAALGARAFEDTFAHLYPPEDLETFLNTTYALARVGDELGDPDLAAWLAETDTGAVGYALAGPCKLPHPEVTHTCGEIKRLYVLKPWQGGLIGRTLLDSALTWLEAHDRRPVWLGVWSGNERALGFYARRGFEIEGSYEFKVGKTLDHEFIMRRA